MTCQPDGKLAWLPLPVFHGERAGAPSLRKRLEPDARAVIGRDRPALRVEAVIVELLPLLALRLRSRPPELGIELVAARHPAGVLAFERGIVGQRAQLGRHAFHVAAPEREEMAIRLSLLEPDGDA